MNYAARVLQESAKMGFRRLENFRRARLLFIKAYVGQYYDQDHGSFGQEPLNMAFTAIRALVPNLVTRNPQTVVGTHYKIYRDYAELLALGLDFMSKQLKLPAIFQQGLVDAIFTLGIFKVSLVNTDSLVFFGDEGIDPGKLTVDTVDFDNFTFDPVARKLSPKSVGFLGEKIRVDRDEVLASGLYDNAIVEKLPSSATSELGSGKGVYSLSASKMNKHTSDKLHDSIDLLELWLPGPNVLVTLPYMSSTGGKFLREETYNGPEDGPYTFLRLTPPVPDNPIPVQLAGVWHDLHVIGNRIAKKAMNQAETQKNVLGYNPTGADDAQEIVDARDGDVIKMADPNSAQMFSFGGQNPLNLQMTEQLSSWFDQFSGNTSMLAGTKIDTKVATVANIMSQNAATGTTYMQTMFREAAEDVLQKCAWYMHTDPLIKLPLIRRNVIPAEYDITDTEVRMVRAAEVEETQVFLTPEMRRGDFLDFAFSIKQDSMAPINWQFRIQQLTALATEIIPAVAAAAQISAMMGTPFSFQRLITRIAKMMNIEWIDEIFQDPEAIAQLAFMAKQGPQPQASDSASLAAVRQNKGPVVGGKTSTAPGKQRRQEAQRGANQSQADLPVRK